MQKRALRHFRQQFTNALSSSLASKLKIVASSFTANRRPFKREVIATLPGW
jgi:hypothetical protein